MNQAAPSLDTSDLESTSPQVNSDEALQPVILKADALSELSDESLQAYIVACAEQCNAANARYEATGCLAAAGDRDAWWSAEAAALVERGSRPNVVARMERERGLA